MSNLEPRESHYLPIARRYRPLAFADLVGQEVLTKTLSYSIINNKVAHAYLFSGIRGIGKTTSARIVAKTINCSDPLITQNNIAACDQCQNCLSVQSGSHPDILEIDAASRTSVDDIRTIIESAEYRPLVGKFKIFIIDEVHMLSKNAFNALLKTLEEPPAQVVFIFATTEINKIPLTILSRCQRFDLRRLTTDELTKLLTQVSEEEKIQFDLSAIELIAIKADGSARDALSMLDQAASLSAHNEGKVDLDLVSNMVGVVNLDIICNFTKAIMAGDAIKAIELLQQTYLSNTDMIAFFENVMSVIGYGAKIKILSGYSLATYASHQDDIVNMTKSLTLGRLTVLWQIFAKGIIELKSSHNQLLCAEMISIKAIYASNLPTPKELVESAIKEGLPRHDGVIHIADAIITPSVSAKSIDQPISLLSLFNHLRATKEFELFYYLFNQVSVTFVSPCSIFMSSEGLDKALNKKLVEVMQAWTGDKWSLIIEDMPEALSLKDDIKAKFLDSEEWQMIKSSFAESEIIDILVK